MSRLKLYWPEEGHADSRAFAPAPRKANEPKEVVPFRKVRTDRASAPAAGTSMMEVVVRAQSLRENRQCPDCNHPVVEPIELNDGVSCRSGLPIPGTATLVGFHCCGCQQEWPL